MDGRSSKDGEGLTVVLVWKPCLCLCRGFRLHVTKSRFRRLTTRQSVAGGAWSNIGSWSKEEDGERMNVERKPRSEKGVFNEKEKR